MCLELCMGFSCVLFYVGQHLNSIFMCARVHGHYIIPINQSHHEGLVYDSSAYHWTETAVMRDSSAIYCPVWGKALLRHLSECYCKGHWTGIWEKSHRKWMCYALSFHDYHLMFGEKCWADNYSKLGPCWENLLQGEVMRKWRRVVRPYYPLDCWQHHYQRGTAPPGGR